MATYSQGGTALSAQAQARAWPTPTSTDARCSGSNYASTHTHAQGTTLTDAAVRQWATPQAQNFRSRGGDRADEEGLDRQSKNWPTPRASDAEHAGPGQRDSAGAISSLPPAALNWPTPTAGDATATGYMSGTNRDTWRPSLSSAAKGLLPAPGRPTETTSTPGERSSPKDRDLNPLFDEWLMGLPAGWTDPFTEVAFTAWGTAWSLYLRRLRSSRSPSASLGEGSP